MPKEREIISVTIRDALNVSLAELTNAIPDSRIADEVKRLQANQGGGKKITCHRCGHTWQSRVKAPRFCPACKGPMKAK